MCTLIIERRPGEAWPLLIAANRDEMASRPALAPARHWPDRPHVVAGLDQLASGSWLGLNDESVVCAVLNRRGTLGPAPGLRSRGELVLDALDHADAITAAEAMAHLDPAAWRPFNLVIADAETAWWLRHAGDGVIRRRPIPPGLSLLEAGELNDPDSARTRRYRPLFEAAARPDPLAGDWSAWAALMADRTSDTGDPRDAMCIVTDTDYGTRSSSLLALPRWQVDPAHWLHADGRPGETAFAPVAL